MDLVFFVLLVGALVLVHELGHFMAARAFGVKVLTFSLGFGPALLRIRGRETTYQLGLLPFGGFVRLLQAPEHRDEEPLSAEDAPRAYEAQSIGKRVIIALAGPTMNVLVPLFLFFAVFLDAGKQLQPVVGVVVPGSAAEGALRAGDRVLAIDNREIRTYAEIQARIAASPNKKLMFTVARPNDGPGEQTITVAVTPRSVHETRELGSTVAVGRLGIGPSPLGAAIGVSGPSSPAYRAGLRTFDVITHVGGVPTPRFIDLERRLRDNRGTAVPVNYLRPRIVPFPSDGPLIDIALHEAGVAILAPDPLVPEHEAVGLERAGIETTDLYVATVPEESAEWRAGLRAGDRIRTLDGKPVMSWSALVEDLVAGGDRTREIGFAREGRVMTGLLRIRKEEWTDAAGEHVERFVFRSTHWAPTVPLALIDEPTPIRRAMRMAARETVHVIRFIGTAASQLISGKLTVRSLSGPISIYDVAGRAGAKGAREFLWVMALISINLGLLNLLPIPTLDGGQLFYLFFERIAGRPLPIRVREVLGFIGLLLLLAIMAIALRNDLLHRRS
jgi:regulator of sigma E protease